MLHLPFDQVYRGAFSEEISGWFMKPIADNFGIHATNMFRTTARSKIIHFSLVPPPLVVNTQALMPFWLRMGSDVVCPSSRLSPFVLRPEVRDLPELQRWYRAAEKLDVEIKYFTDKIYTAAPWFTTRGQIAYAWPEVASAVPTITRGKWRPTYSGEGRPIREKIEGLFTPLEMARLTDMLATAIMLPDRHIHNAWIGINKEDFDETT